MNCNQVQNLLSTYLDGEMSGHEMIRVRAHLSDCPECSAELEILRTVKFTLGSTPTPEPPEGFESRLLASVRQEALAASKPKVQWLRLSLVSGLATAAVVMAYLQVFAKRPELQAEAPKSPRTEFDLHRDQASMAASDGLSGRASIVTASYGR